MIDSAKRILLLGTAAATVSVFHSGAAFAQQPAVSDLEIVVTARKREESLQDVPVVVTAFNAETIERNAVDGFEDLAQITPGLYIYAAGNSAAQGAISLRGIQTGSTNLASDQAVALNVDGVQIDSGLGLKAGMFDLAQIEVLKGPQALYFGKNSSGGVVAIRTADPTDELFLQARGGYEFGARERFGELIASGPLSDTLKARAAVSYSTMDGFFRNLSPTAVTDRAPNSETLIARGTLQWEPSDRFDARFKLTYSDYSADQFSYQQKVACFRPGQTAAECEQDRNISQSAPVDVLNRYDSDDPFSDSRLFLAALDLNYELTDSLTLSATTGYYDFNQSFFDSVLPRAPTDMLGGNPNEILVEEHDEVYSLSQEVRLTSNFDGPFNFMMGAFFDDRSVETDNQLQFGATANPRTIQGVDSNSYSFFGQASYDILDTLELTGGARYTNEKREYSGTLLEATGPFPVGTPLIPLDDKLRQDNISPEVTLTWRPTDAVTLYGAYKQGFKSGSFDLSSTNNLALLSNPREIRFDSESAEGFEVGLKTLLFDRQLRFNVAAYHFEYTGLQLSSFDPNTTATRVLNAGGATTKGVEFDLQFAPRDVEGLVVNAALIYNHARYDEFITDCNQTQLISGTCPLDLRPPAGAESQSLAGEPLRTAPDWAATWGFALDRPLTDTLGFRAGVNFSYSSSYNTEERGDPLGIQEAYVTMNANLGIAGEDKRWSLDLLGVNLTNELIKKTSNSQPLTGGGGFRQDYFSAVGNGRQVRLQLTIRN